MARKSYIYRILARLAYLQATQPVYQDDASASDLYSWLEDTIKREGADERYIPRDPAELKGALRNLEGIGVVQGSIAPASDDSKEGDSCRWRFAGDLPADPEILRRDGGSGDEPPLPRTPGDGDGGDGDGGDPGGLAQILAHPVLFALDEKDLNAALANAFGANPTDGQE
jgi:hypothetical protein